MKAGGIGSLCGVWIDDEGLAHVSRVAADGGRHESAADFHPFA